MKILNRFLAFFIIMFVGCKVSNKFSYNLMIENRNSKWFVFMQHPIKSITNRFKIEDDWKEQTSGELAK